MIVETGDGVVTVKAVPVVPVQRGHRRDAGLTVADHPRGLVWDDGKLYVLHPPVLGVFEAQADGTAGPEKILIDGISTPSLVQQRGADHTTNGIRMGIDGWIYIAMGDYGCINAKGKDGRTLTHRGGGNENPRSSLEPTR